MVDERGDPVEGMAQNIFHAKIIVDHAEVKREERQYVDLPEITSFVQGGADRKDDIIEANFRQIKADVASIVKNELNRIQGDPALQHLLQQQRQQQR
jgi:hypothetical protein